MAQFVHFRAMFTIDGRADNMNSVPDQEMMAGVARYRQKRTKNSRLTTYPENVSQISKKNTHQRAYFEYTHQGL